jgi:Rubisco LSMT substrate-binding
MLYIVEKMVRGFTNSQYNCFDYFEGLASHFDDVTVRSMRALYCTTEEWNTLVKQSGGTSDLMSLNNAGVPLSADTEAKIFKAFNALLRLELAEKPTSLDEDMIALSELNNKQNIVTSKDSLKGKKGVTTSSKKGFQSQQLEDEKIDSEVLKKIVKKKDSVEVDPSGFYSDGEFAALTFRIEKKKILMDALLKSG